MSQRRSERCSGRRRTRGGDQRERLARRVGRADEVVAKRKRKVVEPLKVIDQNERRPNRLERAMGRLEDANRFKRRGVPRRGAEQKLLELAPLRRRAGQRPEELGGGGER